MNLRLFVSPRWRWATLLVLVLTAVFIRLGIWQLDRLEQRRAQNQQILAVLDTPPYQMDAARLPATQQIPGRWVTVTGTYDLERQMVLLLQNWQNRAGVNLITPLVIEGSNTAVLVDRGWIPNDELANLPAYDERGPVTVEAYVTLPETLDRANAAADTNFQPEIYRVDTAVLQTQLPYELQPVYLVLPPGEDGNSRWPYRQPREVDISDGPHLGYALQWFAFALIAIVGYGYFVQRGSKGTAR
jgi:surfeit locus 1 family protein